jgi:hypothetical protein
MAWAALWLCSAVLWLLPANSSTSATHDAIAAVPSGAGWLTSILDAAANATAGYGTTIAIVMAVLSAAISVAVLRNRYATPALVLGIAISLVYWVVNHGLGGVFTGQATDIGTAPLVILIAALIYAHSRRKAAPAAKVRAMAAPAAA